MKIKKGDVFECIKDVVMVSGYTAYFKGKCYTSDNDGCITDESGDEFYHWIVSTENYFRKLSDVEVTERKNPINENIVEKGDIYVKRFPSGAIRSDSRGKTRFDFLSPYALELVAKHHTNNSDNFNDEDEFGANYMKGIKPRDILPSLLRHENDLRIAILEDNKKLIKEEMIAVASNALMALHQIVLEEKGLYKEIYDKTEYVRK